MGVSSLWEIVGPSARPVRLEALSRKRLAVDASIWIYQFLKAVRDKDGQAMQNSHIVGFFRRVCKLLYFGILPVFVFDGAVHPLKRQTIAQRKDRREGQRVSAKETAEKLLAIQLQKLAEQNYRQLQRPGGTQHSPAKLSSPRARGASSTKLSPLKAKPSRPVVYFSDLPNHQPQEEGIIAASQPVARVTPPPKFRKEDEYQLPPLEAFTTTLDDLRVLTELEYKSLTANMDDQIDGVDLRTVDPASYEFSQLRLETQYMVLSNLRIRSRLRMGFSKAQLDALFPSSMEFSRFQIQMVQKRNYLTQRLMNAAGMESGVAADGTQTRRVAGEKDRAYTLQRASNGYAMFLEPEGQTVKAPIVLDPESQSSVPSSLETSKPAVKAESDESDVEWEEVSTDLPVLGSITSNINLQNQAMKRSLEKLGLATSTTASRMVFNPAPEPKVLFENEMRLAKAEMEAIDEAEMQRVVKQSILEYQQAKRPSKPEGPTEMKEEVNMPEAPLPRPFSHTPALNPPSTLGVLSNPQTDRTATAHSDRTLSLLPNLPTIDLSASSLFAPRVKPTLAPRPTLLENPQPPKEAKDKEPTAAPSWFSATINDPHRNQMGVQLCEPVEEDAGIVSWEYAQAYMQSPETHAEAHEALKTDAESDVEITGYVAVGDVLEPPTIPETASPFNSKAWSPSPPPSNPPSTVEFERLPPSTSNPPSTVESERLLPSTSNRPSKGVALEASRAQGAPASLPPPPAPAPTPLDFSDLSDLLDLETQLQNEDDAYITFKNSLDQSHASNTYAAITNLDLLQEQRKAQLRDSDSPTQTMILDVQELLMRFGIPFITATAEAEAQCCELVRLGLVDGIVTDDSDVFLFGGDTVYRNMFSDGKYVECYFMADIERDVGLTRRALIDLALLLGSDYTEGLRGVGKVLAMEILAEFANNDGSEPLVNFRTWWLEIQNGRGAERETTTMRQSLRKKFTKQHLHLSEAFPSLEVAQAYLNPDVDHDKGDFKWGTPDLDRLRTFLMYNVGWSQAKVDEVLVPLIRDINRKHTEGVQSTLGEFYPREVISRKTVGRGKRLASATERLTKKRKNP